MSKDKPAAMYAWYPHDDFVPRAWTRWIEDKNIPAVNPASDTPPPPTTDVDKVVDALDKRLIGTPDRTRLRKALDTADAPLAGRAGQNEALGRAIR